MADLEANLVHVTQVYVATV